MSRSKRVLTLVLAALAALAVAAPAQAGNIKASCLIVAEVKVQDKDDPDLGIRLVGGKGFFGHAQLVFSCVGVSKGAPDAQVLGILASGAYSNIVCGTAKAWATIVSLTGPQKWEDAFLGRKLAIDFVSGAGLFYWHSWAKSNLLDLKDELSLAGGKGPDDKNYQPAGFIQVGPPLSKQGDVPNSPPGHCTKAFSVTGSFMVDF